MIASATAQTPRMRQTYWRALIGQLRAWFLAGIGLSKLRPLGIRLDAHPETVAELVAAAPAHTVVEYGFAVALLPAIVVLQRAGAASFYGTIQISPTSLLGPSHDTLCPYVTGL